MLLFVECRDSFSGIIADYLTQLGQQLVWVDHNDDPARYRSTDFTGVVLSPGPGRPETSGRLMDFVSRFAGSLPTLGICLGHQALAVAAGGRVGAAMEVVHGKVNPITLKSGYPMWQGLPNKVAAVRYHSLAVLDCGADFEATAWTSDGQVMAMAHRSRPVWGLQWHPEALLSESGPKMLANWLTFAHIPHQSLDLMRHLKKPPMHVGPLLPLI